MLLFWQLFVNQVLSKPFQTEACDAVPGVLPHIRGATWIRLELPTA